jgi:hypothetical protein
MLIWQGSNVGKTVTALRLFQELGLWRPIARSAAAGMSHTGDTAEATLATVTIPANSMGPNGILRWWALWGINAANTNSKTLRYRWPATGGGLTGTQILVINLNTTAMFSFNDVRAIWNKNATNSQSYNHAQNKETFGVGATGLVATSAVDTTASTDLSFTGQCGVNTDTITLHAYLVEVLYGA